METNHNNNSWAVGMVFLQGAIVGTIVGLLFAPRSGREFRRQLKDSAQQAGKRLRELADDGAEVLHRTAETGQGLIEKGRKVTAEAVETGQHAMQRERERLSKDRTAS